MRIIVRCLAPDKSTYYLFNYEHRQGKCKCTNLGQEKFLEGTNKSGEIPPLLYLHVQKAMYMLRLYLTLYGNNKDQVLYMHKKSTAWETSIRVGGVQQYGLWEYLNSTTLQAIKSPLPDMTMYEK